jgi:hypothetical protein
MTPKGEIKIVLSSPKIKNRNGFPGKRITEFEYTLTPPACQSRLHSAVASFQLDFASPTYDRSGIGDADVGRD